MNGNMNFNQQPMNNNYNQGMMNNNMNPNMNMNMNQGMMNGGMMNQQPMMQQPVQAPVDPEAEKKKKKIIGTIKKLFFFAIIFTIMYFGKQYIDKLTYDYETPVKEALNKYYISDNVEDLNPIKNLFTKYKNNSEYEVKMQNYIYEQVKGWYIYIDNKYVCDNTNANSCAVQLVEFKKLNEKLENMHSIKVESYSLISPTNYETLIGEGEKKVTALTTATRNTSYTSPQNSDTIYKNICAGIDGSSDDCDCRDGTCKCTYYDKDSSGNKTAKTISCYKPETITKK